MTRINLAAWQASARTALAPISENPGMEAQLLLAHTLERPRTWVIAHPEVEITSSQQDLLSNLLARLIDGTPLPYLTGQQEFFGLDFHVSPAVLRFRAELRCGWVRRSLSWGMRVSPSAPDLAQPPAGPLDGWHARSRARVYRR